MPLSGGEADKLGNRYEKRWTVRKIIDILNENAVKMKIEPLGKEEEKTEFWVKYKNGKKEFHQVKRQNASKNNWTISKLEDVLFAAHNHLMRDENNHFVFVSQTQCSAMREIGERIQSANSLLEFFEYFITNDKLRDGIKKLADIWDIKISEELFHNEDVDIIAEINKNKKSYQILYNILERIHFKTIDTESLKEQNIDSIKFLVKGEAVVGTLLSFIDDNIHKEIIAADVWNYLSENGYEKNNYAGDRLVASKIETLQERFKKSLEQNLINNALISRLESEKLLEFFNQDNNKLILLNGNAGSGKSSVLFQFVKMLEEDNIPYLPLRLDRQVPNCNSSEKFGESLNLPNSPEITISNFSADRNSVLIIDQMDAIKWTSSNYRQAWECIAEIINRGLQYKNLFIVVSCRFYDLNNDPQISAWKANNNFKELRVRKLDREKIEAALSKNNVDSNNLAESQISLLQNPLNLFLFTEVVKEKEIMKFDTSADLFDKYYRLK
ncbi:MAG: NACHT domain-containing protein, partial [bacterium]